MAVSVGDIQVSLSANTAPFDTGMRQAEQTAASTTSNITLSLDKLVVVTQKADAASRHLSDSAKKVGDAHEHAVKGTSAVSAAIRTLEGNITNNVQAAESFLSSTLGLQKVVEKAFPVVGGIALLGVLSELYSKARETFDEFHEAPHKIEEAFRGLAGPLRSSNDELQVTNDKLSNAIAKLEGRHENGLKVALDEAVVAADKLGDALDKDITALGKLLKENQAKWWQQLFGQAGTSDLTETIAGKYGQGGFQQQFERITEEGNARIRAARDAGDIEASKRASRELRQQQMGAYDAIIGKLKEANQESLRLQEIQKKTPLVSWGPAGPIFNRGVIGNQDQAMQLRTGAIRQLELERDSIQLSGTNAELTQRRDRLTKTGETRQPVDVVQKRIDSLLADARAASIAQNAAGQGLDPYGKAAAETEKVIAGLNNELKQYHQTLTLGQQLYIRSIENTIALANADSEWRNKLASTESALAGRTRSQQLLTEAVGKGAEALRAANVETQLMQALGQNYDDPAWMKAHERAVTGLRGRIGGGYDAQRAYQSAASVNNLTAETEAVERLTAAQLEGAEAVRRVELQNRAAQLERAGASGQEILAVERRAEAERQLEVAAGVGQRLNARRDELRILEQQRAVLEGIGRAEGDSLALRAALQQVNREILYTENQQLLAAGTARDGWRVFYREMTQQAEAAAQRVHNVTVQAFQGINDQLARLLSGQKTSWGSFFTGLSESFAKMALQDAESGIFKKLGGLFGGSGAAGGGDEAWSEKIPVVGGLLGKLGGVFGGGAAGGKRDGSSAGTALYVQMAGDGGAALGLTDLFGGGGGESGGGAASGESGGNPLLAIVGKIFGGFRAEGGSVDPGRAYVVGERGPEVWTPPGSGTIVPNHKLGGNNYYTINAQGTDAAQVEQRVRTALVAVHGSAIRTSVQAQSELQKRRP